VETRICKECGIEHPLTEEFFQATNEQKTTYRWVCRECYKRYMKSYREQIKAENGDRLRKTRESKARWKKNNPEKAMAQIVRRTRERQHEDPNFKWLLWARRSVRYAVTGYHKNASNKKLKDLTGLEREPLRDYLVKTFEEIYGYPWDGIESTHIDHIIPLCTESTLEGKKKLFHYSNMRLIREADNRAKGTSLSYQIKKQDADAIAAKWSQIDLPDD